MNKKIVSILVLLNFLVACGGGSTGSSNADSSSSSNAGSSNSLTAAEIGLSYSQIKEFKFNWSDAENATYYKLLENPDGGSGFSQIGESIGIGQESITVTVPLYNRLNASYILQTCNELGCIDSKILNVSGNLKDSIGYIKANYIGGDLFGTAISMSHDGTRLAVGASEEGSNATGVNGDEGNNSAHASGAVYIFNYDGNSWNQDFFIKASNTEIYDSFGAQLSLSGDGNTLVVGAADEGSNARGINGDQNDNSASKSGAVYVYTNSNNNWTQRAYIKASNSDMDDGFGGSGLSLNYNGSILAVGASSEDSNSTGVNGDSSNNSASGSGAVYLFALADSLWAQEAYIKASNTDAGDAFGVSLSLDNSGNILLVGATAERGGSTGVNGDDSDNSSYFSGAAYLFSKEDNTWTQKFYIKASNTNTHDRFGSSVCLSGDATTLAIGAFHEDSRSTGIDGDQTDNSSPSSGAVYLFTYLNSEISQQAYLKASNTDTYDYLGSVVSLSSDGNTLAVAAVGEDSTVEGVYSDGSTNNDGWHNGAVYIFNRNGSSWSQTSYLKATNTDIADEFGYALSISGDGKALAIGAPRESSNASGISGDDSNNNYSHTGAVYLY